MRKTKHFILLLMAFSLVACTSCAGNKAMTDKQQGILMETLYKTTYLEVKAIRENPNATPAQKNLADQKEAILKQVFPVLTDFMAPVDKSNPAGQIVGYGLSQEKITLLFRLIDQLTQLAVKQGGAA